MTKEQHNALKRAQANYTKRLSLDGASKIQVWLSAEAHERLNQLAAQTGSKRKVLERLILKG